MDFAKMDKTLQDWKAEKADLLQKRVDLLKPATELDAKRKQYLTDRISDVSAETLNGLKNKMATFEVAIRQIHVKDVDLVDRCESCHMGIQEPVTLTKAAMGGEEAFISHPDRELLKVHDPERFGCTPCHGGNGVALTSVEKAHGYNEHWLWPLHATGESGGRLPAVPFPGNRHRNGSYAGCGPRDFPSARLHGLPSL